MKKKTPLKGLSGLLLMLIEQAKGRLGTECTELLQVLINTHCNYSYFRVIKQNGSLSRLTQH